jgi:hypothetical protein
MGRKAFDILDYVSEANLKQKIEKLGEARLTKTSHNFEGIGNIKIIDAAKRSYDNYSNQAQLLPAIALIEVVLAANRNYNKHVLPNIKRLKKDYPKLISFSDLSYLIDNNSQADFYKIWGPKDDKKYQTLKNIVNSIDVLRTNNPDLSDYQLMNNWANKVNIEKYTLDEIGQHKNIAIATVQHLRMVFGANTVKPDQRVIEVLENEFGLKYISQINSIKAVEQISSILGIPTLMLDQIFVLYGSGYYNRNEGDSVAMNNIQIIHTIAKKLKNLNVDFEVISKSTDLSLEEILAL